MIKMSNDQEKMAEVEYALDKFEELNETDPQVIKHVFQRRSGLNVDKFNLLFDEIKDMHKNYDKYINVKKKTRGQLLEQLIQLLVLDSKVFKLFNNVTNDTNEYDIIVSPSKLVRVSYNAFPAEVYQLIICECKNYKDNVGVTWIGKLYSLLSMSNVKLGIIFSYNGITGDSKSDAQQLINKIYLRDKVAIISIDKDDLEKIRNGETLCDIIENKCNNLKLNSNLEQFKIEHPSEIIVENILSKIEDECKNIKAKK